MKQELLNIIRQHYPKHNSKIEDAFLIEDEKFGSAIILRVMV